MPKNEEHCEECGGEWTGLDWFLANLGFGLLVCLILLGIGVCAKIGGIH